MHQHIDASYNGRVSRLRYPIYCAAPTEADSLALALRGLPVAARALMVGIHPDDEDSALLAEFALRYGIRTVYLSLTRGEGGQNRIGPETGMALGVLRTGELLAARRYDGAEQLFAPYIDFGYARDAEAAFAQWGREHMIGTVVQAIREVQPDILISVWSGTTADGHGHHQACGIVTHAAFELASDPAAFPAHLQAGLMPWQPRRLLVRVRDASRQQAGDLHIDTGRWDPVLGRSCFEVAMQGRSQHRCQNMGALQSKGRQPVTYRVVAGVPVRETQDGNPVADLPLQLDAWVEALLGANQPSVLKAVDLATQQMQEAWDTFHPQRPEQTASILLHALGQLERAMQLLAQTDEDLSQADLTALHGRLQERIDRLAAVWCQASGIALEVLASQPQVTAGASFEVETELFVRGRTTATLRSVHIHPQPGCQVECLQELSLPMSLSAGDTVRVRFRIATPQDEETAVAMTLLPWLRLPNDGYRYRFPTVLPSLAPCAPPLLTVEAALQAGDLQIPLVAPLVYREADPGLGEVRQAVRVVPRVTVEVAPSLIVLPEHTTDVPMMTVKLHAQQTERGCLVLQEMHEAGTARQELGTFELAAMTHRTIHQKLPLDLKVRGRRTFHLLWERFSPSSESTKTTSYHNALQEVRYPHIEPGFFFAPARCSVSVIAVKVAPDLTIGYVPGTGDYIPQALATLGVAVETIDETRLQFGDLQDFDVIMVGVRALETRPLVAAHRERLWHYTRAGGTIIVQYQKPREDGPTRFIPFDGIHMERPIPRVSQKNAPVRLLAPDDPLLTYPNRIGPEDFAGWVQERGLYFLPAWPSEMQPLLESADQRDVPRRGGLLRARLGAGHYVYCGYALFRQLPAGVPGAYRLLANLVSLPRSPLA